MMGFKAFHSASATISGIETAHMIRKGQIPAKGATAFQIFAELAAQSCPEFGPSFEIGKLATEPVENPFN